MAASQKSTKRNRDEDKGQGAYAIEEAQMSQGNDPLSQQMVRFSHCLLKVKPTVCRVAKVCPTVTTGH